MKPRLTRVGGVVLAAVLGLAAACGADARAPARDTTVGSGGTMGGSRLSNAGGPAGEPVSGASAGGLGEGAGAGNEPVELEGALPGHGVTLGRVTQSLDGAWLFATDVAGQGEAAGYFEPDFDDSGWDSIAVPGSWNLHDRFAEHEGVAWYRTTFETPADAPGTARLHFDAAYYDVQVWLNGTLLGSHRGGYTPFEFDVGDELAAAGALNTIAVRVDNSYRVGAWYFWGGLTRSVRLDFDEPVRIERQKVVALPDLESGTAEVSVVVTVSNSSAAAETVTIAGGLEDLQGRPLLELGALVPFEVPAHGSAQGKLSGVLPAGSFELWHIDRPTLYRSRVRVTTKAGQAYELYDQLGVRRVELVGSEFRLNGEAVRLAGYNRVADDRVVGSSEPQYLVRRDLDRMKAAGSNLTRIFHTPEAPELLDYADRIGMLLVCEIPVWGTGADLSATNLQPQQELEEMIYRDQNHPSIFAWSVANEIDSVSQVGRDYVQRQVDHVRRNLDDSRLLTIASNHFSSAATGADEALQYTDFSGGNSYGGFAQAADKLHALYPDRPALMTEFSPDGYTFGVQRETLEHTTGVGDSLRLFDSKPWLFGASVWTFNDYRSNYAGTSSNHVRGWGVQDTWGGLKQAYFQAQAAFAPVAALTLKSGAESGAERTSLIGITPRGTAATSIPSFTLNGYRLLWQAVDGAGELVAGQVLDLDSIAPGSAAFELPVSWSTAGNLVVEEQVTLLAPTGHEVAMAKSALAVPDAPAIDQVVIGDGAVRATFARVSGASNYRLSATSGAASASASTALSSGIYLGGLNNGTEYELRLIAENERGAAMSGPITVTPSAALGAVSPRLQAAVPIERGFVLGYIVNNTTDAGWEIEIQEAATQQAVTSYETTVVGATRYDQLEPNRSYRVRLRKSDGNGVAAWSEWLTVHTLGAGYVVPAVAVTGVLSGATTLALRIVPPPSAERYFVTARPTAGGDTIARVIERSAVDALLFDGLAPATSYDLSVRVQTPAGLSEPSLVNGSTR